MYTFRDFLHSIQHIYIYCRMLNVGEHLSWRFGHVWRSRCLNLAVSRLFYFHNASIMIVQLYILANVRSLANTCIAKAKMTFFTRPWHCVNQHFSLLYISKYYLFVHVLYCTRHVICDHYCRDHQLNCICMLEMQAQFQIQMQWILWLDRKVKQLLTT